MGKIILCAWIIGILLVPSIWLNAAEVQKNDATIPASSEKGDVYVRTVAPLSQNEAETYSALSKESKGLPNLKAGMSDTDAWLYTILFFGAVALVAGNLRGDKPLK